MNGEKNTNPKLSELPPEEMLKAIEILQDVIERGRSEITELVEAECDHEEMAALSQAEVKERIDLLVQSADLERQKQEVDRKAINLGLLRLADAAPRCDHIKGDGKRCRAPALRCGELCHFHFQAKVTHNESLLRVGLLENRLDVQLLVRNIMNQLVHGRINASTAAVLLKGVQVAGSTLRPKRALLACRKSKPATDEAVHVGNRDPMSMTEEELDAEIAEIKQQLASLPK